ncbi:alpha,alpha-trehalose-phosphate synthase [UDP-forming], putative [Phytophthora infestans T30-4]|uniref:Alpha,alpha-trehalose-phosphate synthase [UDP-forming], putative n=1 Tax=Phytophthora infestans (strain T30-4) TaxID=403677 RepID=D0MW02_PHYIT|nr:alpha,alpha-trehalose-phosphate synthase [UDP-forming], putative [Phytophthora infestans T30-4]EEY63815.1 alpha,alpha-trehalose-phosphate synthase [UDP-forming], putative [Phytophthora infestans T30-4]|eukprot:XP_002907251.1 alpha,alpha-trehalose-phosphate synthase [UDP-forming], putative [Phytophthora infestans T30-4]
MDEGAAFKERETALLRELSALYTKLNQVREKRVKAEQESGDSDHDTDDEGVKGSRRRRRVLLVTRTLPFWLVSEDAQSQWRAEFPEHASLNGAMEIFQSLHENYDCVWIGSVHGEIEPSEQNTLKEQLLQDRKYYPVFLDEKRERLYYQGFCKTVMWPLFHSCPPTTDDQITQHETMEGGQEDERSMQKMWQAYVATNQAFADAVQEVYEEGDLVWIQGYHLTLVPQMVQNLFPNDNICLGFFMHIPFPSAELYRIINNREEILTGMLGADLIGFQTYEYARHFQSACVRLLGLESSHKGVDFNGHFARVTICPVGIDAEKYIAMVQSDAVKEQMKQLESQFAHKKVILGVDQLDQTKGLVHKLLAVEELFTHKPELAKEVVFLQIVTGASVYESALESQVESLVSRINSKLQDIGTEGPVQYLNKEIAVEALIALYALADALVITPVRDGMNTVPFGYIVCREATDKHARVILSEFAGCAQSLGGARLVNPWNTEELTDALQESLQDNDEVMRAHQHMYSYVSSFTSWHWADNFLEQLHECSEENALSVSGRELSRRDMTSAYSRSSRRLIFINYEGVLAAEASIPELAYPPQELIWQLSMLTKDPRNTVVLVSARSTSVCEQWFAGLSGNLVLAAEYGVYVKWVGENEYWHCMVSNMDMSWWEHVVPLLEYYTERTPGAYIERKESSVAWHYRDCDLDHGLWQASELLVSLREITRSLPVSVCPGNRYLEVRPQKVSKATLFERIWEFMNWSLLFPDEDPVTTEYFGEQVHPPSSPMIKPRGFKTESIDEDTLSAFSLDDHTGIGSEYRGDRKDSVSVTMDAGALSLGQLEDDDKHAVDFVLVIASGDDRTDEDLFSFLVPPPIDLEAYCRQLEKDDFIQDPGECEGGIGSSSFGDISDDMSYNAFRRLLGRDGSSTSLAAVSSGERAGLSTAASLARLSQPNDADFLMLGENMTKLTPLAKPSISEGAANMFPVAMLNRPSNARRDEITEKSKFTPRRDFPPSAALFKAMKVKYGDNFGIHRLPDTPAACWALVCPPTTRAKLEDGVGALSPEGNQTTSVSTDEAEDGRYRFPVNTFVCTLGRKLSQAPYFIKNSGDLFQLLQEMGMSSHIRKQRMLSMGSVSDM